MELSHFRAWFNELSPGDQHGFCIAIGTLAPLLLFALALAIPAAWKAVKYLAGRVAKAAKDTWAFLLPPARAEVFPPAPGPTPFNPQSAIQNPQSGAPYGSSLDPLDRPATLRELGRLAKRVNEHIYGADFKCAGCGKPLCSDGTWSCCDDGKGN